MNTLDLLTACLEKLELYRAQHSGEYVGGMEFTALRQEIGTAIHQAAEAPQLQMTEARAREILGNAVKRNNELHEGMPWILWLPRKPAEIGLDGDFTVDDLEAIVWWVRNKGLVQ